MRLCDAVKVNDTRPCRRVARYSTRLTSGETREFCTSHLGKTDEIGRPFYDVAEVLDLVTWRKVKL